MALKRKRLTPKPSHLRKRRRRGIILGTLWRLVRECWRVLRGVMRTVLASHPIVRIVVIPTILFLLWLGVNWVFHTFHKPTEIFFPLDQSLNKSPVETWREYESLFREHATAVITPEFLAALAQVEGGGNPVARTYWRWQLTWNPLELFKPASSAVGMYQITDGTFDEARRLCIHDHVVVEDGPWHDLRSCWFNSFYTRILPSHAIELTAALLDRQVGQIIGSKRINKVTLRQKQNLAAVIHLCGAGAGRTYATRKFRLTRNQRCGDHDVSDYLARINELKFEFAKPAAGDKAIRKAP
ncbi:MAG: lytic transglycosylase domain-containing protein [Nitrospirales bacterium]|nr:lytic transglycosylase domain-containing protein [Nitrospirales bacterium]